LPQIPDHLLYAEKKQIGQVPSRWHRNCTGGDAVNVELAILQRPALELRPSAALVAYAQLLSVTAHDMEQLVERELGDNPALERAEPAPGAALPGTVVAPVQNDPADEPGLLAELARDARATLPRSDHAALDLLLGSIDDRGFLTVDLAAITRAVGSSAERVEALHALVRQLAPVGFASRDVRECLDVQLQLLDADPQLVALARRLVAGSLADLAAGRYGTLARQLGVDRALVVAARDLIRRRLRPFPVLDGPLRAGGPAPRADPDVIIALSADDPAELRIELSEERHLALRVSPAYDALDDTAVATQDRTQALQRVQSARTFVRRLHQRWSTMRRIVAYTVSEQRAFVLEGPAALRPLTRAQVAAALGLHESTVSRAVAGRSALLPCGRVVELKAFYTASLCAQEALRELIAREPRPLSDDELAAMLSAGGHRVARRTVAKYRSLLDIPPSSRR
jgi:RNA polymerase sigma-54 factor